VLESLVEVLEEQSDEMLCGICLVNSDGSLLEPIAGNSLPANFREGLAGGVPIGPRSGSCGTAAHRKQAVAVSDIATDQLWTEFKDLALRNDLRSCWSTPIFSNRGDVLGTFAIYHKEPREPDPRAESIVDVATRIAGIAIERARSEAALLESEEILRATVESTADGILVVNEAGQVIYSNERFAEMWRIDPKVMETKDDAKMIESVLGQLVEPERFLSKVRELYQTSREDSDELVFKDGRIFERFSRPLRREGDAAGRVWSFRDITERANSENALRESESKFRAMAETVSAATFIFQGTKMQYVNSAAERVTGYGRDELLQMDFWDVIHPEFRDLIRDRGMARQRSEDVPSGYEVKILTKAGEERWVDFTAGTIDFEGAPAVLGTAFDITERKIAEEALRDAASHDPLTGLLNRRAGLAAIEERLEEAKSSNTSFSMFVMDLDKFKAINDSFSHETGDEALVNFSEVIEELVGDRGVICRLGGDEFQIGLDNTNEVDAFEFARTVRHALHRKLEHSDAELRPQFTVSIGIATYPDEGTTRLVLGRRADRAMYAAKVAGGNTSRAWHQLESQAA
jgi:diguanylate cyclase (GGDEF)-like protein/PAS domain S-box-containing protein